MGHFTVTYEGELRCRARHEASGTEIFTDAPVDNRGRGSSFSPTDLLAVSTATCMLTIMGIRAQDQGWDLTGTRVDVEKHMVADPQRRVGRLVVHLALPGHLDERARASLERAAHLCPVKQSLSERVAIEVTFGWGEV
jgi:putative redox protein